MKKHIVLLAILSNFLFAGETYMCSIPNEVINAVAEVEAGYQKGGYKFLIGLNSKEDITEARKLLRGYGKWYEGRSLDCNNTENCIEAVEILFAHGIYNIDIGRYQINHKWHRQFAQSISDYFDDKISREIVCKVIEECVNQYGYNWYGVSCYHSRTPSYNEKYSNKLYKVLTASNRSKGEKYE